MSEGPDPTATARRGRRDPELAARLEAEMLGGDDDFADAGEAADQSYIGLNAGDTVMGKVTFASTTELGDAWYTFGAQSAVLQGENTDDAIERVGAVLTEGVLDIAAAFHEGLTAQIAQQREAARQRRIVPTQS